MKALWGPGRVGAEDREGREDTALFAALAGLAQGETLKESMVNAQKAPETVPFTPFVSDPCPE